METKNKTENKREQTQREFAEAMGFVQLLAQSLFPKEEKFPKQVNNTTVNITVNIGADRKGVIERLFGWMKRK